jgi:hypothetical protein
MHLSPRLTSVWPTVARMDGHFGWRIFLRGREIQVMQQRKVHSLSLHIFVNP